MASVTVTYIRGKSYVKNEYSTGSGGTAVAHGLVGELWVHGLMFETIERMDGYMHMQGGKTYRNSSMYWLDKYGSYVLNPWLGTAVEKTKKNILFHPANYPSHLEGCVSFGFLNTQGVLERSKDSLSVLWDQCGGRPGAKSGQIVMTLAVEGDMPSRTACSPWSYGG